MSTKTTFKRVALVAVAALGLGVVSVAPSTAATNADALTISAATSTQTLAETVTATSSVATLSFLSTEAVDSMSVTASLVSGPAGNVALPFLALSETTSATVNSIASPLTSGNTIASNVAAIVKPFTAGDVAQAVKAKFKVYVGTTNTTAPTLAGTYVVKLTPAVTGGKSVLNAVAQTVTITVKAASGPDGTSTSYIGAGAFGGSGSDSTTITASKVASTVAATVVTTQNSAGVATAATAVESLTATITGAGTVGAIGQSEGRSITVKYNNNVTVYADGTSGVGTLTIVGATTGIVYKTATVTFFDPTPASATVTVKKAYPAAGKTTSSAVYVTVKDASGNVVKDATVELRPVAYAGIGETTTSCAYSATYSTNVCSVTGTSVLKFGPVSYKAHVTGADVAATEIDSAAFTLTFADIVATSVTVTAPSTGSVGDKVTVTLTAKEKNGYPIADSTYEGGSANGSVGGIFWNTTTVPVYSSSSFAPFNAGETITTLSGIATKDLYLPAVSGTVTGSWTLAGTAGTGITTGAIDKTISGSAASISIAVSNPGVDAATDAANEATDAANAATDAALAAADAADAATAAAQDASDAVAALSATVAKLVASLKAQITSLTNLVIKIQKKVRA